MLIIAALWVPASAYVITFEVPSTVYKGEDIYLEGTSNIPAGTTMQIALYQQMNTIRELERKSFTIQDEGYWSTNFETADLDTGTYKIEIPTKYTSNLGSSSVIYQMFEIVDRSLEIQMSSPSVQKYTGMLEVAGRSTTRGNAGIELLVEGPYGIVFPRQWISTDANGYFSEEIPIENTGTFEIFLFDNDGLILEENIEVTPGVMTPQKTSSSSPGSSSGSSTGTLMQVQEFSSTESPAYFTVVTNPGILDIYTSSGKNWVISYIGEDQVRFTVDSHSDDTAEKVSIPVTGGKVYIMVYPADESESGYVTLYAEGAYSVTSTNDAADFFNEQAEDETPQSGPGFCLSLLSAMIALVIAGIAIKRQ